MTRSKQGLPILIKSEPHKDEPAVPSSAGNLQPFETQALLGTLP